MLYRRLFPAGVALLAALMFAIDDSHHFAVLWLSNRGGIYAVMVGVLALLAHLRWRVDGQRAYAFVSFALVCVGLSLGEWVLPMFAYIAAFELLGARDSLPRRALALLPVALRGKDKRCSNFGLAGCGKRSCGRVAAVVPRVKWRSGGGFLSDRRHCWPEPGAATETRTQMCIAARTAVGPCSLDALAQAPSGRASCAR